MDLSAEKSSLISITYVNTHRVLSTFILSRMRPEDASEFDRGDLRIFSGASMFLLRAPRPRSSEVVFRFMYAMGVCACLGSIILMVGGLSLKSLIFGVR